MESKERGFEQLTALGEGHSWTEANQFQAYLTRWKWNKGISDPDKGTVNIDSRERKQTRKDKGSSEPIDD